MALDRNLKAWSRLDGMGRIVPGSTVLRKQKPKNGTWEENKTYQCCNTITISYTVANTAITSLDFIVYCNSTLVFANYTGSNSTTAGDIVDILNNQVATEFPAIGSFSTPDRSVTSNAVINFTTTTDLAKIFCSYSAGLSFVVEAD